MPTLIEINEPKYKYCNKFDIHCPCFKCSKHDDIQCYKLLCKECEGWGEEEINYDKDRAIPYCFKRTYFKGRQ